MEEENRNECCEKGDSPSRNNPPTSFTPVENPRLVLNTSSKRSADTEKVDAFTCSQIRGVTRSGTEQAVASIDKKKGEVNVANFKPADEKMETPEKGQVAKSLQKGAFSSTSTSIPPLGLEPSFYQESEYENHTQQQISNNVATQAKRHRNETSRNSMPVHMEACQFKCILSNAAPPHKIFQYFGNSHERDDIDENQEICVTDEEDESVKMTCGGSNVEIYIEKEALDEINPNHSAGVGVETIKLCIAKHLNGRLNLDSSGYLGDNEADGDRNMNVTQNKKFRRKFGVYPYYRIRFNGVKWMSCDSSDEEGNSRSSQDECRGSRKLKTASKKFENPKPIKRNSSPSCDEENDEESEPLIVHVISTKRRKKVMKQKPDTNSTTSEASDMESLTDCSLCFSDNMV